ncbi:MAG: hypothetical protein IJQ43_06300 [Oscillospiraceae bacterium]|nr:hypothetical protein [Oscillospiraceae bacterium]
MDEQVKTEKTGRKGRLALALFALALILCAAVLLLFTVRVGGRLYFCTEIADARAAALSCEDYEAAAERAGEKLIRWSVPIGGDRFDSFSETIALSSLPEDEIGRLGYFPYLKEVDALDCADYAALAALAAEREDLRVLWTVPSSDGPLDGCIETLEVRTITPEELEELLPLLPRLGTVDLRRSAFDAAQTDAFAAAHGGLRTLFTVPLWGRDIPGDTEELRLEEGSSGDAEELAAALSRLKALKKLDLRDCALTPSQLARILPLCEDVEPDYVIRLFGRTFTPDCEEMDLSGIPVGELGEIEAAAALMPKLKKVVMSGCGVPDEEMDALDQRHEDIRFVWTVYFSIYALRTDATFFCAADVPQLNYDAPVLNDAQLYPIRYCRDMVALDLGHMWIHDLSFLYNMPKLQYLILVGGRFRDITPIGSLQDLKYLEIFQTQPADISPLLNCKKLEHLNMCYCFGFDLSPLKEMKQLKRLWFTGLGPYYGEQLAAALPDTKVYYPYNDPDGSTGGGWREDEAYYEMRDVFAMYYQPGGTGVHN